MDPETFKNCAKERMHVTLLQSTHVAVCKRSTLMLEGILQSHCRGLQPLRLL